MKELIKSKQWKEIGCGSYASYFQISKKKGVKVFNTRDLTSAKKEFEYMITAYNSKCTPKPYDLVKIRHNQPTTLNRSKFTYGIIMQHIKAKELTNKMDRKYYKQCGIKAEESLYQKLASIGILHYDLHSSNILALIEKNERIKLYAIDFTPGITYIRRRKF